MLSSVNICIYNGVISELYMEVCLNQILTRTYVQYIYTSIRNDCINVYHYTMAFLNFALHAGHCTTCHQKFCLLARDQCKNGESGATGLHVRGCVNRPNKEGSMVLTKPLVGPSLCSGHYGQGPRAR